jgi:ABC-type multidrug transport system fused ATPase/permease subunit
MLQVIFVAVALNVVMPLNFGTRAYTNPAFVADIRHALYQTLLERDISYFDVTPTGVLVSRLSQDVTVLFQVYIDKMLFAFQNCAQMVAGLAFAISAMWPVGLPMVGILTICGVVYYLVDQVINELWNKFNANASAATSKAEEVITSFRTIKSFDNELLEAEKYQEALKLVDAVFDETSIVQGLKDAIVWTIVNVTIGGMLYLSSWFLVKKPGSGFDPGDIMVLLMSMLLSALSTSQTLSMSDDFKKARISAAKVLKILQTPAKVDQNVGGTMDAILGRVEFRDVGFRYETRQEWAVRHLTFTVEPGETVALIGESGCGKSTTLQLLQRFYEIDEGEILIDGVNIQTLSPRFLRSKIAIVPQGPVLFSMSVKDNIRFAKGSATDDEIATAARIGNSHDFIMELPQGYDTWVHQTSLSGGQKQRICISRAILTGTPILLLDEATAALDTESEQLVQKSLEEFRQGKTAILVAHRLATVMNADRILVFQDGHVEESGTHQELMERGGLYSDLIKYQLQ